MWGISTSDWHNGAKTYEEMLYEVYADNGIISYIRMGCEDEDFIGVFLSGDYYDKKFSLNDPCAILASNIFLDIFNMCRAANKYFIVLQGTYSHDFSQLEHFISLEVQYEKFKLITTVTEFEVDKYKCLAIPEEYVTDYKEYYKPFFSKKYDLLFGHGTISFAGHVSNSAEKNMSKAPTFNENELLKICKLGLFGHIHQNVSFKHLHYNSSLSRLCFGEEDPKGFIIFNEDNGVYTAEHVENIYAPMYVTVNISDLTKNKAVLNDSIKLVKLVNTKYDKLLKQKTYDEQRVLLKVKIPKDLLNAHYESLMLLKETFTHSNTIFISSGGEKSLLQSDEEINSDEIESYLESKYSFLLKEDSLQNEIRNFILSKHGNIGNDFTDDDIIEAISKNEATI